jgi:glucose/arabinose dehydrogenase
MQQKNAANAEKSCQPARWRLRVLWPLLFAAPMPAAPIPPLADTIAITGLVQPTVLRFAGDGQVFVAEKSGRVLRFDHLGDSTPELVADLRTEVHDYWDRGLLGLAIHPEFPVERSIFVLYTADAPPGQIAPFWGDTCPTPPGGTIDGCPATGRLSRLDLPPPRSPGLATETVLIGNAFCQQYPSHSIGSLAFGPDGALYASAGDGASFNVVDVGQLGGSLPNTPTPVNACGDPPAEGGALRSQDLRTPADPTGLSGAILRLDPQTGEALPDNPLFGGENRGDDRLIAYGLRNPFRFAVDQETGELWLGDVGWNDYEEINRIPAPADAVVENFGWPCYEGALRQPSYDAVNRPLCETLYAAPAGTVATPFFSYRHGDPPDEQNCGFGGVQAAIAGVALYQGDQYPQRLQNALVFADYQLQCIYALPRGQNGLPDPAQIETLVSLTGPVSDLTTGPGGDLFYLDIGAGTAHRLSPADRVFMDGFESGNTGRWSSAVP